MTRSSDRDGAASPGREIVAAAVARGWLDGGQAWTLGEAAARGGDLAALLAEQIGEARLAELTGELTSSGTADTRLLSERTTVGPFEAHGRRAELTRPPGSLDGARFVRAKALGAGGGGRVIASLDRELGRQVALKLPHDAGPSDLERFLFEARVTARLEHPNIVPIYDLGLLHDGTPYYAMRVVEQRSLADLLRQRRGRDLSRLLRAVIQVCRALAYAHDRGVIHGDVKPGNILIGDYGEVYLADWGLARVRHESPFEPRGPRPRLSAKARGTLGYMAPELLREETIDPRTDLFALGVVLFQVLTGHKPFAGDSEEAILMATIIEDTPDPRDLAPDAPLVMRDLCIDLLAKDIDERPAHALDVAAHIEDFLEGTRERERRIVEAERLCDATHAPRQRHEAALASATDARARARALLRDVEPWESIERKRPAWRAEAESEQAELDGAQALAEAIELYTKALGYAPDCERAHRGLAELYWARSAEAERARRDASAIYYRTLTLEHDREGHYRAQLSASAELRVSSDPPGAVVALQRFVERDHQLVLTDPLPHRHLTLWRAGHGRGHARMGGGHRRGEGSRSLRRRARARRRSRPGQSPQAHRPRRGLDDDRGLLPRLFSGLQLLHPRRDGPHLPPRQAAAAAPSLLTLLKLNVTFLA